MIHVAVVAHVARAEQATRLATTLAPCATFWDDGSRGEWVTHEQALRWGSTIKGHLLVIQEDALPIDGLLAHVATAIEHRPKDLIGLYVGRQRPNAERVRRAVTKADQTSASWLTHRRLMWGVATVIPCHTIEPMLYRNDGKAGPYDVLLGRLWRETQQRPVVYTWPSLVDHADGPSFIEGRAERPPGRVAWRVGVPTWNDVVVQM